MLFQSLNLPLGFSLTEVTDVHHCIRDAAFVWADGKLELPFAQHFLEATMISYLLQVNINMILNFNI